MDNQKEIEVKNKRMVTVIATIGFTIFSFLLVVSFFSQGYRPLRVPYFILFIIMGILLLLSLIKCSFIKAIPLYYTGYTFLVFYCIFTSRFITPDYVCVLILAFLFEIPILIIDKAVRINSIEVFLACLYICLVVPYKTQEIALDEAINVVFFTITSLCIGRHLGRIRLENLQLIRKSKIRETTDALTGLFNRRKLFNTLSEIEENNLNPYTAVAMIDIDFFKVFNDTFGHQAGDECLVKVATCLDEVSQKYSVSFYRYGGEEFLALFQYQDDARPIDICKEINRKIADLRIPHKVDGYDCLTCSIGVASIDCVDTQNIEKWIGYADTALYASKNNGRNTTFLFNSKLEESSSPSSFRRRL